VTHIKSHEFHLYDLIWTNKLFYEVMMSFFVYVQRLIYGSGRLDTTARLMQRGMPYHWD